jgi:hypothetical protein
MRLLSLRSYLNQIVWFGLGRADELHVGGVDGPCHGAKTSCAPQCGVSLLSTEYYPLKLTRLISYWPEEAAMISTSRAIGNETEKGPLFIRGQRYFSSYEQPYISHIRSEQARYSLRGDSNGYPRVRHTLRV